MPTELEKEVLRAFADNRNMFTAVHRMLSSQFSTDKFIRIELSMSDEQLGQWVRARLEGLHRVEEGFREMEKYRTHKEITKGVVHPTR